MATADRTTRRPAVTGPIDGGSRGRPWSRPLADLDARGYVMEEFFLEGTATSYRPRPGAEATPETRWDAERDESAAFKSRILVVRPRNASAFNGTVVLQWLNVTAGYELGSADDDELLSGYTWVGVSAQKVGIDGFGPGRAYTGRQAPQPALKAWDPERYGSLNHPGDAFSFDIFTQAARAVAPDRGATIDPMGGLDVKRLVASGASQSAGRLTTYVSAIQPLEGVFDAFLLTITSGRGTPLGAGRGAAPEAGAGRPGAPGARAGMRLRDELDVPVMIVNSECEALGMFRARRPDSDRFRFWEVAGAPHVVAVVPRERDDGRVDNPLTYRPVVSAAYRHLDRWMRDGEAPPVQPRIEFASDDPPTIRRDDLGNAVGGIRLPEMAAPIAEYRGRDDTAEGLGTLYGWARPFTRDELRSLYSSREDYAARYRAAVARLAEAGAIRPEDVEPMGAHADKVAATLDL